MGKIELGLFARQGKGPTLGPDNSLTPEQMKWCDEKALNAENHFIDTIRTYEYNARVVDQMMQLEQSRIKNGLGQLTPEQVALCIAATNNGLDLSQYNDEKNLNDTLRKNILNPEIQKTIKEIETTVYDEMIENPSKETETREGPGFRAPTPEDLEPKTDNPFHNPGDIR